MSLEGGNTPEKKEAPKTPQQEFFEKYMAFQSFGTDAEKQKRLEQAMDKKSAAKMLGYADALLKATNERGIPLEKIIATAEQIRDFVVADEEVLGIPHNQFTESSSWAMIDLGMHYRHFLDARARGPIAKEHRHDPFADTEEAQNLRWLISERRLGNDAYNAYWNGSKKKEFSEWRKFVGANQEKLAEAMPFFKKTDPDKKGLGFYEKSDLGKALHNVVEDMIEPEETTESAAALPTVPVAESASIVPAAEPLAAETPQGEPEQIDSAVPVVPEQADAHVGAFRQAEREADIFHEGIAAGRELVRYDREHVNNAPRPEVDHHDTVAKPMRDSLRSLGAPRQKAEHVHDNHSHDKAKHESHEHKDHGHDDHGHGSVKVKEFRYTAGGLAKAGLVAIPFIPSVLAWVTVKEVAKTTWESVKGMFGVFWKLAKKGFSFKALNEGVDKGSGGGGGHKVEHKADHGGGHDAHGGDHGKKKDDHGHGGGDHH